jgi:hypothetical protein
MIKADRKGKASGLENLRPYHRMESMSVQYVTKRKVVQVNNMGNHWSYKLLKSGRFDYGYTLEIC